MEGRGEDGIVLDFGGRTENRVCRLTLSREFGASDHELAVFVEGTLTVNKSKDQPV